MPRILTASLVLGLTVTAAFAHEGVKDPTVKARMEGMKTIGANMKVLAQMAKGEVGFDAAKAGMATSMISETAAAVPQLFKDPATDPKSESKPAIWTNFDDFTKKAMATQAAATAADTSSLNALRASLGQIGGTCKDCHDDYRIKK